MMLRELVFFRKRIRRPVGGVHFLEFYVKPETQASIARCVSVEWPL